MKLTDVPDGGVLELPGGRIAWRRGGDLRVFVNVCPHFRLALNYEPGVFKVYGEMLVCAHHYSVFRFADGQCVEGQCVGVPLEVVPFRVVDGRLIL